MKIRVADKNHQQQVQRGLEKRKKKITRDKDDASISGTHLESEENTFCSLLNNLV